MAKPLRVLLVEDSERDAARFKLYLRRGGYDADAHRVDTVRNWPRSSGPAGGTSW